MSEAARRAGAFNDRFRVLSAIEQGGRYRPRSINPGFVFDLFSGPLTADRKRQAAKPCQDQSEQAATRSAASACLSAGSDYEATLTFVLTRRRRIAPPTMPKPPIIMVHVAGSGTAPALRTTLSKANSG